MTAQSRRSSPCASTFTKQMQPLHQQLQLVHASVRHRHKAVEQEEKAVDVRRRLMWERTWHPLHRIASLELVDDETQKRAPRCSSTATRCDLAGGGHRQDGAIGPGRPQKAQERNCRTWTVRRVGRALPRALRRCRCHKIDEEVKVASGEGGQGSGAAGSPGKTQRRPPRSTMTASQATEARERTQGHYDLKPGHVLQIAETTTTLWASPSTIWP